MTEIKDNMEAKSLSTASNEGVDNSSKNDTIDALRGNIVFNLLPEQEYHPGNISYLLDDCGIYDIFDTTKATTSDKLLSGDVPCPIILKGATLEQLQKPNGNQRLRSMLKGIGLEIIRVVDNEGNAIES